MLNAIRFFIIFFAVLLWVVAPGHAERKPSMQQIGDIAASSQDFSGMDLSGRTLTPFPMMTRKTRHPVFKNANLDGADLTGMNLDYADFSGASLKRANMIGTHLCPIIFTNADLEGANLSYVNVHDGDARGANFRNVNFRGATLVRIDFTDADVAGADFTDVDVKQITNFDKARNRDQAIGLP